jgi:hypothetical protein
MIAAKIIILYFSFEVVMAELRRVRPFAAVTGVALLLPFVRGSVKIRFSGGTRR